MCEISGRVEHRRGVFAAAAFIFLAGVAGARGVARSLGLGLGLSCNRGYLPAVVVEGGGHLIDFIEFMLAETGGDLMIHVFSDLADVADAQWREFCAVCEEFVAEVALGLELAELGDAFVEKAVGLGAGAIDRVLGSGGGCVLHGVSCAGGDEGGFDLAAAAQTPQGAMDFVGEIAFEDADGGELIEEIGSVLFVEGFFAGADEIAGGEEAVGGGVFGAGGFTGGGSRPGRSLGVGDVGCDLRGG